jgi:D-tagatose-1,6-bisphosphate aldolase subunit GatZ/KbaZ
VEAIGREEGLPRNRILFGGDHLGPNPWRKEPADTALKKAADMVEAYVLAGFSKIHLDTSMGCAGEPVALEDRIVAGRAAALCRVAESAAAKAGLPLPVYVLGTEVPIPGGADHALATVEPTSPEAARDTIAIHRDVFSKSGLAGAFERVVAFVVQPGVEFGNDIVIPYDRSKTVALSGLLDEQPKLIFEAHSTDYQSEAALTSLVSDGFPILKVGPGLTFAYREALYALDLIASELVPAYGKRSLAKTMEALMTAFPVHWQGYYQGNHAELRVERHYSYSDRIRYYWNSPEAEASVSALMSGLESVRIPETVLHQYLPHLSANKITDAAPENVLVEAVDHVLAIYDRATMSGGSAVN